MSAIELDVSKWDAWRPEEVARLLEGVEAPWCVAAGWALDLFLGGQRREHRDLEIAVPGERFDEVAEALAGFELFIVLEGGKGIPLTRARDRLDDTHQTWVLRSRRRPLAAGRVPRAVGGRHVDLQARRTLGCRTRGSSSTPRTGSRTAARGGPPVQGEARPRGEERGGSRRHGPAARAAAAPLAARRLGSSIPATPGSGYGGGA